MKKIYTLIFAQNNINGEENYLIDLANIAKNEDLLEKTMNKVVFYPRQQIVNKILKFARECK